MQHDTVWSPAVNGCLVALKSLQHHYITMCDTGPRNAHVWPKCWMRTRVNWWTALINKPWCTRTGPGSDRCQVASGWFRPSSETFWHVYNSPSAWCAEGGHWNLVCFLDLTGNRFVQSMRIDIRNDMSRCYISTISTIQCNARKQDVMKYSHQMKITHLYLLNSFNANFASYINITSGLLLTSPHMCHYLSYPSNMHSDAYSVEQSCRLKTNATW